MSNTKRTTTMIKRNVIMLLPIIILWLTACQQEEALIFSSDSQIMFGSSVPSDYLTDLDGALADTVTNISFVYTNSAQMSDTIFFNTYVSGMLSSHDRHYRLEQVQEVGAGNAIEGVHYLSFNSEDRMDLQEMEAGKVHSRCGIVLLRDESLKTEEITLKFRLVDSDDFLVGSEDYAWRKLVFSDMLLQPNNWKELYFGSYSRVKHQFAIDATGQRWDEAFIERIWLSGVEMYFWCAQVRKAIQKYNEEHPGEPLRDENNDLVEIPQT